MNFKVIRIFTAIFALAILFGVLLGGYYLIKGMYVFSAYASPIVIGLTLYFHYKVYPSFIQWIYNKFKESFIKGMSWTLLSFFGFPFVLLVLFYRALIISQRKNQIQTKNHPSKTQYTEYEIIEEELKDH